MNKSKYKKGFTLIELIVVIAILAILTAIAVPAVGNIIQKANIASDQSTVATLNNITQIFQIENPLQNPFNDKSKNSDILMNTLVTSGYLNKAQKTKSKDASFKWLFDRRKWHLFFSDSFYVVSTSDGLQMLSGGHLGYIAGSYSGESKDILIPLIFDGFVVKNIWQDTFNGKGLLAVSFEEESKIKIIHARAFLKNKISTIELPPEILEIHYGAFMNNNLTEINLPLSLKKIEGDAFQNNILAKITIGPNVSEIGNKAFGKKTDQFKQAYENGGEGTYNLVERIWVKST